MCPKIFFFFQPFEKVKTTLSLWAAQNQVVGHTYPGSRTDLLWRA